MEIKKSDESKEITIKFSVVFLVLELFTLSFEGRTGFLNKSVLVHITSDLFNLKILGSETL